MLSEKTMKVVEKVEEMACRGIEDLTKRGDLTMQTIGALGDLMDIIKDIHTVSSGSEKSYGRYDRYQGGYEADHDRQSYEARRRDSMGRYTDSTGYGEGYRDGR